jgi:hypothetical protein
MTTAAPPFENEDRPLVNYPQMRQMSGLTSRPPQLKKPFSRLNANVITPSDVAPAIFSKNVHILGCVERTLAARSITPGVEPLGACHGCRELRFETLVGLLHRFGRRLVLELCIDGLTRHQSREGVVL